MQNISKGHDTVSAELKYFTDIPNLCCPIYIKLSTVCPCNSSTDNCTSFQLDKEVVKKNLLCQKDELYSKGLRYISDILDDIGEIMGFTTFTSKFDIKTNFVDFYS